MSALPGADIIRTLASILISLLIAAALATVLYALVLAVGRDPLPGADERFAPAPAAELVRPQRLAPVPGIETSKVPPTDLGTVDRRVTLPVQLRGAAHELRGPKAGIATYHGVTGGDFRWYPLDEALSGADGSLMVTADARTGQRLTVTFAADREHARHGYLARLDVDIAPTDDLAAPVVTLDGAVHRVRFDLPTDVEQAGPLRLQRVDDRQWLPMLHATSGLTLRRDRELVLQLGPGTYELQDPLAPERAQQFTVPDTTVVEVTAALPPARDGRL